VRLTSSRVRTGVAATDEDRLVPTPRVVGEPWTNLGRQFGSQGGSGLRRPTGPNLKNVLAKAVISEGVQPDEKTERIGGLRDEGGGHVAPANNQVVGTFDHRGVRSRWGGSGCGGDKEASGQSPRHGGLQDVPIAPAHQHPS
jgi:hypothetical protein